MIQATFGEWLFAWTLWAVFFYWIGRHHATPTESLQGIFEKLLELSREQVAITRDSFKEADERAHEVHKWNLKVMAREQAKWAAEDAAKADWAMK